MGSGHPVPHLDPPMARTCLKCSFQRVVIIGRKVGLDYNSWYACLPLIRHVGRSSGSTLQMQTLIAGERERERERRRERERERLQGVCTRFFCFGLFLRILKLKVSQSILLQSSAFDEDPKRASAFVRQSRTFHSVNALRTFYRMQTFLN